MTLPWTDATRILKIYCVTSRWNRKWVWGLSLFSPVQKESSLCSAYFANPDVYLWCSVHLWDRHGKKREKREGRRAFGSSILKGSSLKQGTAAAWLPYFKLSFLSPEHLLFLLFLTILSDQKQVLWCRFASAPKGFRGGVYSISSKFIWHKRTVQI